MTWDVALILGIDGLANGAVYLLAGLGLVLIFSVTRVVFVPFGDVAAFAALSLAAFESAGCRRRSGWWRRLRCSPLAVEVRSLVVRGEIAAHPAGARRLGPAAGDALPRRLGDRRPAGAGDAAGRGRGPAGGADHPAGGAHRPAADRRCLGAGAADRLAGAALPALRTGAAVLRPRGLAHRAAGRRRDLARRLRGQRPGAADGRRGGGAERALLPRLRAHHRRQGAARHGRQPDRRAPGRHPPGAHRAARLRLRLAARPA